MVDAVVFDLGGNLPPTFAVPDASGLVPLTLPASFLDNRDASQPSPSSDAVQRFASAMGGEDAGATERAFRAAWSATESPQTEMPAPTALPAALPASDVAPPVAEPVSEEVGAVTEPSVVDEPSKAPDVPVSVPEVAPRAPRLMVAAPIVAEETGDASEEAVQAAPHVVVAAPAPQAADGVAPQAVQEVAAVSAATARTETLVETVNQVVEAVVGQLVVTPSLMQGEGEVRMTLKPTVLDGSDITLSAKGGTLTVAVAPATPSAEQAVTAALPRLEIALAEHAPAFRHVEVALAAKKGKIDEVA